MMSTEAATHNVDNVRALLLAAVTGEDIPMLDLLLDRYDPPEQVLQDVLTWACINGKIECTIHILDRSMIRPDSNVMAAAYENANDDLVKLLLERSIHSNNS